MRCKKKKSKNFLKQKYIGMSKKLKSAHSYPLLIKLFPRAIRACFMVMQFRDFNFFHPFFELCHGPKTKGHGTISPLSVLFTAHALAEFCDHINSKLGHSKLEYNQGRSQTGYSAGLNVFVFAIYRSTVI